MKFYVVWEGHNKGVYTSWEACKLQIDGYTNPKYKSFASQREADEALQKGYQHYIQFGNKTTKKNDKTPYIVDSFCVDAACSGNPGIMEYRGVETSTGKEVFKQGPFAEGTNNIGEFLAVVHALALFKKMNLTIPIYSDSVTALAWVRNKKAKTTLAPSNKNKELLTLITRAEAWLHNNTYTNPLLKWNTEEWGEIPADFGRKK